MEWVAVRTVETTGGTTAKTVETTGGTVGSEEIPSYRHGMTHCRRRGAGSGDLLVVFGITGDLARGMTFRSL
jgi:hypothetical protein